ncbi:MAG TPA: tRNA uridine-5-carboxymethylaminomethyl(34) synthesis GTPase MnmE, partial [Cyclobacteriaceae bacterium]
MNPQSIVYSDDTIIALATPPGVGAISVVRLSGKYSISVVNKVFQGKNLEAEKSHTIHLGQIKDEDKIIDEVLVSIFREPNSYTKENVVEISCHGSNYIIKEIISLFIRLGIRFARPGEFTQRAFINGRFDLVQAEAVADLIASDSDTSHEMAMKQMRGGFSKEINTLRESLIHFASLIELELDFGEEDVQFASRKELKETVLTLKSEIEKLISSFRLGNAIKNGVPTVIVGKPNVGKSTLLNALLKEDRAIVSEIPGTTRDFIEDEIFIEGIRFRFIDTAGLRDTEDAVEAMGVARTREKMQKASLILYLFDLSKEKLVEIEKVVAELESQKIPFLKIGNKKDIAAPALLKEFGNDEEMILISAATEENLEELKTKILHKVHLDNINTGESIVTNVRHLEALRKTSSDLDEVLTGLEKNITHELLAQDIR